MKRPLATALHVLAITALGSAFWALHEDKMDAHFATIYGGRYTFLTVLSLAATLVSFVFALLLDAFPRSMVLRDIKTATQIVLVPVQGVVTVLYWGLTFYNPLLLRPADPRYRISLLLDIGLHLLPATFLWLDFLLFDPRMNKDTDPLLISALVTLAYSSWVEHTSSINEKFPYPFLNHLAPTQRGLVYVACIPLLVGLYHLANGIHQVVRKEAVAIAHEISAEQPEDSDEGTSGNEKVAK